MGILHNQQILPVVVAKRYWLFGIPFATVILAVLFFVWPVGHYNIDIFADLTARPLAERNAVLLSGHVMGSNFCVGSISHREKGGELNVRMRSRVVCPSQRSGDFSVEIPTLTTIRKVTYGDDRTVLPSPRNHASSPRMSYQ